MYRTVMTCFFVVLGLSLGAEAFAQSGAVRGQGQSVRQEVAQEMQQVAFGSQEGIVQEGVQEDERPRGKGKGGQGRGGKGKGGKGKGGRGGKGKGGKGKGGRGKGKGGKSGGISGQVFDFLAEKYDKDGDKKISPAEHNRGEELFASLDKDKDGFLTAKDWEIEAPRGKRTESQQTAPVAGAVAPDFELTLVNDAEKSVTLSSFAGEKPVALIFGSCS